MCAVIAAFTPITELAGMISIGALAAMTVVAIAAPVLRGTRPDLERPFRVPLSPIVPAITAVACLYLMLNLLYGRTHSFLATGSSSDGM